MSFMPNRRNACVACSILALIGPSATAVVRYVDDSRPANGNGASWSTAFKYLRDALAIAQPNDVIKIGQGIYRPDEDAANPTGSNDRELHFDFQQGMTIQGGYAGFGAPDPEANDPVVYTTILSGDLLVNDDPDEPSSILDNTNGIVLASDLTGNPGAKLLNLTVSHGFADGLAGAGGGIRIVNASPAINRCTFVNNVCLSTTGLGGGGGAINNFNGSSPTIARCVFTRNSAVNSSGGSIFNVAVASQNFYDPCVPTIVNCEFEGNTSTSAGGAIAYLDNGTADQSLIMNCTFAGNLATSQGGGVRVGFNDNVRISSCTFVFNEVTSATGGGGGFAIGNSTSGSGTIRSARLENSIFWGNKAPVNRGSEIAMLGTVGGTLFVDYCDVRDFNSDDGLLKVSGTLNWGAGNIGDNLVAHDPRVRDLPDRGTDGIWGTLDDDYGNLNIQYNSACIKRGSDALIPPDLADIDGDANSSEPTPFDIANHTRARCTIEMGAYEWTPTACSGDADGDGDTDIDDLTIIILNWDSPGPAGDIAPIAFGCSDNMVGIDDLTAVILNWGCGTQGGIASMPQSIQDCLDLCGTDSNCFTKCVQALREAGLIP